VSSRVTVAPIKGEESTEDWPDPAIEPTGAGRGDSVTFPEAVSPELTATWMVRPE